MSMGGTEAAMEVTKSSVAKEAGPVEVEEGGGPFEMGEGNRLSIPIVEATSPFGGEGGKLPQTLSATMILFYQGPASKRGLTLLSDTGQDYDDDDVLPQPRYSAEAPFGGEGDLPVPQALGKRKVGDGTRFAPKLPQTEPLPAIDPTRLATMEVSDRKRRAKISWDLEARRERAYGKGALCFHALVVREESIFDETTAGHATGPSSGQGVHSVPQRATRIRVTQNMLVHGEYQVVHGFLVRASVAPYLDRIIKKHGAVDTLCMQKSQMYKGFLAEMLVLVTLILYSNTARTLTAEDYQFVEDNLADLEDANFKVDWLHSCFDRVRPLLEFACGGIKAHTWDVRVGELKYLLFKTEKRASEAREAFDKIRANLSQEADDNTLDGLLGEDLIHDEE